MKSIIQKGGLYLIDDAFCKRCQEKLDMGHVKVTASEVFFMMIGTNVAKSKGPVSPSSKFGSKCVINFEPMPFGIVVLVDVENHGNKNHDWDICKIYFNNSFGVRYIYRAVLELAERLDKI